MHFTTLALLGVASLATAAPTVEATAQHHFNVTNFVFGCTVGCDWNFDVSVPDASTNHPAVKIPVHCSGNLDDDKDFVKCGTVEAKRALYAYIGKADNILHLEYEVQRPKEQAVYRYYGHKKVYSATGNNANLQKPNFKVAETKATGVA